MAKPILVTIRGYDHVNVAMQGEPQKMRYVLHFNEHPKPLVLNSTNGDIIASITGAEEFDDWIGKKIVLYNDPNISFGGKLTGGIRARAPRTATPPVQAPAPKPAPVQAPVEEPEVAGDGTDPEVPF